MNLIYDRVPHINEWLIKGKYQGETLLTAEDRGKVDFKEEDFITSIKEQYDNLVEKLDNYLEFMENANYPTDLNSDQLLDLGLVSFLVNIVKNTNRYDKTLHGHNRQNINKDKYIIATETQSFYIISDLLGPLDTYISVYRDDENTIKVNGTVEGVNKFMFDRYNSQLDYTNFALTHIKTTCCLAVLYIIRTLQTIGRLEGQIIQRNIPETPEMKLLNGLNRPIPNLEYSLSEISKIKRLRREAYTKLNRVTMSKRDGEAGQNNKMLGEQNDDYDYETEFKDIFKTIVVLVELYVNKYNKENPTNKLVFKKEVILEGVMSGKEFYPVTTSLIYAFDDYFNESDDTHSIINDHSKDGIKHNVLTNHLNYLAQCIVATSDVSDDMENMYTVAQFEKFCNKLIYYCTCITTHWTFQESQPSVNSLIANASSIYELYGKNETKFLTKLFTVDEVELELGDSTSPSKFTFNFIPFINEEIQTIFKSTNLTTNVKYVAWLTLYCLNGYFVHLYNKDMLTVVSKSN